MTQPDDVAELYAKVAARLPSLVREEAPDDVHRWLLHSMQDIAYMRDRDRVLVQDWVSLVVVLAAAVPDTLTWAELTAWAQGSRLRPHGTKAAVARHQAAKQPLCGPCLAYEARRKREAYARKKASQAKEAA